MVARHMKRFLPGAQTPDFDPSPFVIVLTFGDVRPALSSACHFTVNTTVNGCVRKRSD